MNTEPVDRVRFPGISPRSWEHPSDRAALEALRRVPGFDLVLRRLFGAFSDRALRLATLASAIRVDERQFPRVYAQYREACRVLDVERPPELYVARTPFMHSGALGVDRPFITLSSGQLLLLEEDELLVTLAQQLAHCLSGHALYKTMLRLIARISWVALSIPGGSVALAGVKAALLEWDRKSELSADRAALLVGQDVGLSQRMLMKLAGGGAIDQMDVEACLAQAQEYRTGGGILESAVKMFNLMGSSHPFPVLRLAELTDWAESGDYQRVLEGHYPRRAVGAPRAALPAPEQTRSDNEPSSLRKLGAGVAERSGTLLAGMAEAGGAIWGRLRGEGGAQKPGDEN